MWGIEAVLSLLCVLNLAVCKPLEIEGFQDPLDELLASLCVDNFRTLIKNPTVEQLLAIDWRQFLLEEVQDDGSIMDRVRYPEAVDALEHYDQLMKVCAQFVDHDTIEKVTIALAENMDMYGVGDRLRQHDENGHVFRDFCQATFEALTKDDSEMVKRFFELQNRSKELDDYGRDEGQNQSRRLIAMLNIGQDFDRMVRMCGVEHPDINSPDPAVRRALIRDMWRVTEFAS